MTLENPRDVMMEFPIIAAAKDDAGLAEALDSDCKIIFLLYGSILNIDSLIEDIHARRKLCFVHIDLVDGLSSRDIAVDGLLKLCRPDGIISTRTQLLRRAHQLGLCAVQRVFILDSMSLQSLPSQLEASKPDFIEILPGILPGIIAEISASISIPLIAGGLIRSKQDVMQALQAGVVAISTTSSSVWKM